MKRKKLGPNDPEVHARILERIDKMGPQELMARLNNRKPGVEETDMTGMFRDRAAPKPADSAESDAAAA